MLSFLYYSFLVQTIATWFLLMFVDDIEPWMIWGYYLSPMMYGQNAIVMNEFLDERWSKVRIQFSHTCRHQDEFVSGVSYFYSMNIIFLYLLQPNTDSRINEPTVGKALLKSRGFYTEEYWFWICIGALLGFSIIFNILFILSLTYLDSKSYPFDFQSL